MKKERFSEPPNQQKRTSQALKTSFCCKNAVRYQKRKASAYPTSRMLLRDARNDFCSKKEDLRMPRGKEYQKRNVFWASDEAKEIMFQSIK